MKNLLLFLLLSALFTLHANAQKAEINEKGFFIQGKLLTKNSTTADLRKLLGAPDRITQGMRTIWTYDAKGIFVHVFDRDSTVDGVTFFLSPTTPGEVNPVKSYKQPLLMFGKPVQMTTSLSLLKQNKGLHFKPHPIYLDPATTSSVELFFTFDDAKQLIKEINVNLNYKPVPVVATKTYINKSFKYSFAHSSKHTVKELSNEEAVISDNANTWAINCKTMNLAGNALEKFIKRLAIDNLNAQEVSKSIKLESRTISKFKTVSGCEIPGFEMQTVSAFATDGSGKDWELSITIFQKISQPLFAADGIVLYSFHKLLDMSGIEGEVVDMVEQTIRFNVK
jgi:hypothetical protein